MRRFARTCAVALLLGCSPNYQSGTTECSADGKCPAGFVCGGASTSGSADVCYSQTEAACGTGDVYYCPGSVSVSSTCWSSPVACSTVIDCGGGNASACATEGYVADCSSSDKCTAPGGGGSGGIGGSGSGGSGGGTGGGACGLGCPAGDQCLSGQCCAPPAAGGVCTTFPACGCSAGNVCYPSSTTHAMACVPGNNLSEGTDCSSGLSCLAGFGCFGGVCKRYCSADTDCPLVAGVQSCTQTTWSTDKTDILGISVCERVCDPARPQNPTSPFVACPAGFNCASATSGVSFCIKANPLPAGSVCTSELDCVAGYYCTTSGACKQYCLSNSDCVSGTTCQFTWSPPEYAGTTVVGHCM